jgi:hypothetical protein
VDPHFNVRPITPAGVVVRNGHVEGTLEHYMWRPEQR